MALAAGAGQRATHPARLALLGINLAGGIAVLGSYVLGLSGDPGAGAAVWGGVPQAIRPVYTVCMLLAAAGYFAFSHFVFFRLDPERSRIGEHFGYGAWCGIYALILAPSALWMPLTLEMVAAPSAALWWSVRGVLFLVGAGSLALVAALLLVRPKEPPLAHRLALAGAVAFALQTAVLDALVWPAFFPV